MTEPIRVLHVLGRLDTGGAESRTMDIYRRIDKTKVQFDFCIHTKDTCFFTSEIEFMGGKIYNVPRFTGKNYFLYKKAWKTFFKEHPEYRIIHGHQTTTGFVYLSIAKKYKIPIRIAHSRNADKDNSVKKYCSMLARLFTTHQFSVSRLAGISDFGKRAVDNGRVKIIPNAIQASKYIYNEQVRKDKRLELGLKNNFTVGHVGRFHHQKNHRFLLEIFKIVHDKQKDSKLILIGDGVLREQIEQLITHLGLEDSVILTGIRSDVPDLLQVMDILLFPSFYEGLPGVVLEAQAAGLPCIISDRITDEVKLTNLVTYLSLKESAEYWANEVLLYLKDFQRQNTYSKILQAGYDIESIANWYQEFYLQFN